MPAPQRLPVVKLLYKAGTYTGSAQGMNGEVVVEVEVSDDAILSVKITDEKETDGISDPAIETLPVEIVEYQSLGLDTITGCTVTSTAILEAAAKALESAGADLASLQKPVEKIAGETIEKTADVIVVGGGGAGISAAATVASEGKTVILIEKTAALGGNTLASGRRMECG